MQLIIKAKQSVPAGAYQGRFVGVTQEANDKGPCLRWVWELSQGQYAGQKVGRTTGTGGATPNNGLGKVVAGLSGKPITADLAFSPNDCVGKTYMLIVAHTPNGAPYVESIALI